ncbi:hypothetical protein Mgra_00002462 [Meloidogyne graminicola]|uniref:Uncharacterized protein n=1 Tax=Meloidogyne graminicola TaxID=189291 RepID=A0A8S9ZY02_9BILA|nr:hypothetical protein Mgra_00002462 [Meloidogyne graminicola]
MNKMMIKENNELFNEIKYCLLQINSNKLIIEEIRKCSLINNHQLIKYQLNDEFNTKLILTKKSQFVPFISFNNFSHIQIQSFLQLFLFKNECNFPPEFWCIDPKLTNKCFNIKLCNKYNNQLIYGLPINLKIIFNSKNQNSRNYLNKYIFNILLNEKLIKYKQNIGKMIVELEPKYLTLNELKECSFSEWCTQRILEICIASNIVNINKRNNLLLCLNRINLLNWINNCSNLINQLELQLIMNVHKMNKFGNNLILNIKFNKQNQF